MSNNEPVLDSCPFCGSMQLSLSGVGREGITLYWAVQCPQCCITGPKCYSWKTTNEAKNAAAALWNTRSWLKKQLEPEFPTPIAQMQQELAKLRAELAIIHRTRCQITEIAEEDMPTPGQVRRYLLSHDFLQVEEEEAFWRFMHRPDWGLVMVSRTIGAEFHGELRFLLNMVFGFTEPYENYSPFAVLSAMRAEEEDESNIP